MPKIHDMIYYEVAFETANCLRPRIERKCMFIERKQRGQQLHEG
jgi:hypothetical protein